MNRKTRRARSARPSHPAAASPAGGGVSIGWLVAAVVAAVAVTIGLSYFLFSGDPQRPVAAAASPTRYPADENRAPVEPRPAVGTLPVIPATPEGEVRIPLADLNAGRATFVDYAPQGAAPIRIFALLDGGTYRAALDACEECFYAKQGYFQRGNEMVCRKCGNSYPASMIDARSGGCHPIALPRRSEGDDLVIAAADIEKAQAALLAPPAVGAKPPGAAPTPTGPLDLTDFVKARTRTQ